MCQKFTVEILKTGPQVCPGGDGRGSWEVNLETKNMCWNQTLTSTNIRSETMKLMNTRCSGECTGREAGGSRLCRQASPLEMQAPDANGKARKQLHYLIILFLRGKVAFLLNTVSPLRRNYWLSFP